jgi:TetR/AcrR family transcriptional regulator, cholesterol catabolism regulator
MYTRKLFLHKTFPLFVLLLNFAVVSKSVLLKKMDDKLKIIVQKAFELFYKFGIRSVSMDDVSKELGISKKTLYCFFKNKEELIEKGLEIQQLATRISFLQISKTSENAIDSLLEVSKMVSQNMHTISPSFSYDLKKYYPEIRKKHKNLNTTHIFEKIKENIVIGINEGIYREDLSIDLVAHLYVQRLEDLLNPDFNEGEKIPFMKIFKVMFENHIRGISNQKGIEYFEKRKEHLKFKI